MKILFQGDSITDAGRDRSNIHDLGCGYPKYAADLIAQRHPETEFEFVDLGISGNKTEDLVNRLQSDFVDVGADVVSVLIGVNDTWHNAGERTWIPSDVFEANLRKVYGAIKNDMGAKLMILEPFIAPYESLEFFREDMDPKIRIIRNLAREYADVFVPLDGLLSAAYVGDDFKKFYFPDGVHLSYDYGAAFVGRFYADAFEKLL